MRLSNLSFPCLRTALFSLLLGLLPALAPGATLRVVTYNIAADIDGYTTARGGWDTVVKAIGQQKLNNIVRPVDLLALQETTSNPTTVAPMVAVLNTAYGAGIYAMSPYQATETGNFTASGNGPNALIYNTQTLQLIASVGVGTPRGSSNGEYRQVVRYQFQPVGGTSTNVFYVYVSHMKSNYGGITAAVMASRNQEAAIIRADAATLPPAASILYMGDFNISGSTEAAYQTLTAVGPGQAIDALNLARDNTQTWDSTAFKGIMTESSTGLGYRDDIQFMTQNVYAGLAASGLALVPGSYRTFGNNGTTALGRSVNQSSNTALNNLVGPITAAQALSALTTASDHLPVVADYTILATHAPQVKLLGKKKFVLRVRKASCRLRGTASDADGDLVRVAVKVGNQPYRKAQGTTNWHLAIRLQPGLNKVIVRATDAIGQTSVPVKKRIVRLVSGSF